MSVLVQAFLILSLVVIVLSISLLFRFLSVVAVDRVGGMYFDAAAAGVRIQMEDLVQNNGRRVGEFTVEALQSQGQLDALRGTTVAEPFSNGSQLCSHLEREWEFVRAYYPSFGKIAPVLSWGPNCSCSAYAESVNVTRFDPISETNTTTLEVSPYDSAFCSRAFLGLPTEFSNSLNESSEVSSLGERSAPMSSLPLDKNLRLQSVLSRANGSLVALRFQQSLQIAIDQKEFLREEDSSMERNLSSVLTLTWSLPREVFITILDSVHYAQGSEGITTYLVLDLVSRNPSQILFDDVSIEDDAFGEALTRADSAVLVESPLRPKAEQGILSAETATRFSVGVDGLPWMIAVEAGNSVVQELRRGTYVVVVISLAITLAVAMAAVLGLRVVLTPLGKLRNDMMLASQLRFDGLVLRQSFLREITEMNSSFGLMVARLRSYKPMLMELFEGRSRSRTGRRSTLIVAADSPTGSPSFPDSDTEEDWEHRGRHQVKVSCRFVTRRREMEKKRVGFEFVYHDGDSDLFQKFTEECLKSLGENKFHVIALFSERSQLTSSASSGRGGGTLQLVIKSSRQLEQLLANSPGELHIAVKYAGVKTLLSPFCLFVDLINLALNLGLIFGTIFIADNNRAQRLSVYLFTGLYSFAFSVNVGIALYCLKQGQNNPRFKEWLTQAGLEVSVMILLCSLNTQHVHFLWSQWSFLGALKFNAPRPLDLWKACVRWSMFGFFFSDLMQLFYKVFRLWNSEPLTAMTGIALATSILSIGLNLPKKVTFFAMARRSGGEEDEDTDMGVRSRSGGHGGQTLRTAEVTVVYFSLSNAEKKTLQRLSVESSAFYSNVMSSVKRAEGTVVMMHGSEVVAVFNAPKPLEEHWRNALECSFELVASLKQFRVNPLVVVTTELLPVGTLGSQSRKSFQVCGGVVEHLSRIANLVAAVKGIGGLVATKKTVSRLCQQDLTATFKLKHVPTLLDEVIFEVRRKDHAENLTAQAVSTLAPSRSKVPSGNVHQVSDQAKLLPLFGLRAASDFEVETEIMKFLGKSLSLWLAAAEGEKSNAFDKAGNGKEVRDGSSDEDDDASSEDAFAQAVEDVNLTFNEPAASPLTPQRELRTAGFILGHILRKPVRRSPLDEDDKAVGPEDIEL